MFKLIKLLIKSITRTKNGHLLILLQNNNELRATGGFITNIADIKLGKLKIKTRFLDPFKDLNKVSKIKKPPKILKEMLNDKHFKGLTLRDANFIPDFNKSAKLIAKIYDETFTKNQVIGCIAINYSLIEHLLKILGPIKIDKELVTDRNLFSFICSRTCDIDRHDLQCINNRKAILRVLFKKLIKKSLFNIHKWVKINQLINKSYKNKNMQVWLDKKQPPSVYKVNTNEDFLSIVESNYLGGKSNRYMKRIIFRDIDLKPKETNISLKILWEHTGKYNYPISSVYKAHVQVYIPGNATNVSTPTTVVDNNLKMANFKLRIKPGERSLIQLDYALKGN